MNRFDAIDINMGCPARKVVGSGNGSALLLNPEKAVAVMRAVRENTSLPVRLKLRLGWDEEHITAPELIRAAQALGFESVTVHGRTRMQMYQGEVDAEAIARICAGCSLPIYANGGVTCAEDAVAFLERTCAYGVSIGRAALKQPWIFDDIRRLRAGKAIPDRDAAERVRVLLRLAELSCALRPEPVAICEMRKYSRWLLTGLTGSEALFESLNGIDTLDGYRHALDKYLNQLICARDTWIHDDQKKKVSLDTAQRQPKKRRCSLSEARKNM